MSILSAMMMQPVELDDTVYVSPAVTRNDRVIEIVEDDA